MRSFSLPPDSSKSDKIFGGKRVTTYKKEMSLFFQSDTHYNHGLMLSMRPFETIEEMNETLIEAHNKTVKDKDIVWMLGDVGFGKFSEIEKILKRLNGKKLLCFGNHDLRYRKDYIKSGLFQDTCDFKQIKIENQKISLFHYAMLTFPSAHYGAWNLFGHSHANLTFDPDVKRLDVGVDGREDFCPYSFEEIKHIFDNPTDFKYYKHTEKINENNIT